MPPKAQNHKLQLVVSAAPSKGNSTTKKKKKNKKITARSSARPMDAAYAAYLVALRDPFDMRADGVRMPDLFRYPTSTLKLATRVSLTSDAAGLLAFQLFPCPFYTIQMFNGTYGPGIGQFASNPSAGWLSTPSAFVSATNGSYRVVSWGFRLLLADNNASATGIYTVAPFPLPKNNYLDYGLIDGNTFTAGAYPGDYLAVPRPNAAIETLPARRTFNAQDLQYRGDFKAVGVPYDETCKDFRGCSTGSTTPFHNLKLFDNDVGSIVYANGALPNNVRAMGNLNTLDMSGNIGFAIYASGLPVSKTELSLEMVMHVETVPVPTAGIVGLNVTQASPVGSTAILEKLMSSVKTVMYYGDTPIGRTARAYGMAGLTYAARSYGRRNVRAIEVD